MPIITSPYVSRVLGAEGIGEYSYTYTVAYYFYIVSMMGFDTYGQRLIATHQNDRKQRSKLFSELVLLQILITLIVSVVYLGYVFFQSGERRLLTILQYIYVASAFTNIIWLFEGVEEFKNVAIRNVFVKLVSFVAIFVFVKDFNDLWIYTLIMAASTFVGNIFFIAYAQKYVKFVRVNIKDIFSHIKPVAMLFVPQIGITVFMQMDKLMIEWWSTTRQLGYYQNAEKIINIPVTLILTVGVVIMPRIVSLRAEGKSEEVKKYNSLSMELLMTIGVGCMFGLIAIAEDFVPWFFGADFIESATILAMLSVQIIFMVWENVLQKQFLVPYGRDKLVVIAMTGAAVINAVINALLIPKFDAMGAIVASLIAHLFICVFEGFALRKDLPVLEYLKKVLTYIIPGLIMAVFVWLFRIRVSLPFITLKIIFEIMLGIIIYGVLTLVLLKNQKSILYEVILSYAQRFIEKRK